jgi:hypothetical protein
MKGTNGRGEADHGKPAMQPMPQTGVYPLDKFCLWLECPMHELRARFAELGVPITHETADMAVLLAAIERVGHGQGEDED